MNPMRELRDRLQHYTDGTPTREYDDWESTGAEEMNRLHAKCKEKKSITCIRDEINNLRDLVSVCSSALHCEELPCPEKVGRVLYFYINEILQDIEQELAKQ